MCYLYNWRYSFMKEVNSSTTEKNRYWNSSHSNLKRYVNYAGTVEENNYRKIRYFVKISVYILFKNIYFKIKSWTSNQQQFHPNNDKTFFKIITAMYYKHEWINYRSCHNFNSHSHVQKTNLFLSIFYSLKVEYVQRVFC